MTLDTTSTTSNEYIVAKPSGKIRWIVCGLLFFAVVLSYIDRLVLAVLKPELSAQYGWSETGYADLAFYFQLAYGIAYLVSGRLVDRLGARVGYVIAVTIWTIGHVAHTAFTTTSGMVWARLPLAAGEAATFPAALAATSEWFPRRERALAIGIFNAGSNVGAIITPLIVPFIVVTLDLGWRAAFWITGALSIIWLVAWLGFYRRPEKHPLVKPDELEWIRSDAPEAPAQPVRWSTILRARQTWAYILGRFLIDPVWWTFLFWLPDYFSRQFDLSLKQFGPPLVAVYLMADVGSIGGGWLSTRLATSGRSLGSSRKWAMFVCALCALPISVAGQAENLWVAVALIGLACAAHQGFSANLFALPGDLFPRWMIGSVVGLGGLAGAIGSMLMARYAGLVLETVGSYTPIFMVASLAYLAALGVVHLITPRYTPFEHNESLTP